MGQKKIHSDMILNISDYNKYDIQINGPTLSLYEFELWSLACQDTNIL